MVADCGATESTLLGVAPEAVMHKTGSGIRQILVAVETFNATAQETTYVSSYLSGPLKAEITVQKGPPVNYYLLSYSFFLREPSLDRILFYCKRESRNVYNDIK